MSMCFWFSCNFCVLFFVFIVVHRSVASLLLLLLCDVYSWWLDGCKCCCYSIIRLLCHSLTLSLSFFLALSLYFPNCDAMVHLVHSVCMRHDVVCCAASSSRFRLCALTLENFPSYHFVSGRQTRIWIESTHMARTARFLSLHYIARPPTQSHTHTHTFETRWSPKNGRSDCITLTRRHGDIFATVTRSVSCEDRTWTDVLELQLLSKHLTHIHAHTYTHTTNTRILILFNQANHRKISTITNNNYKHTSFIHNAISTA